MELVVRVAVELAALAIPSPSYVSFLDGLTQVVEVSFELRAILSLGDHSRIGKRRPKNSRNTAQPVKIIGPYRMKFTNTSATYQTV